MHSVQTEMWDPQPLSKHASPLPVPPCSSSRLAHVTTATPAKRITFYKSGDSQFGGIRMAIHKRSFKCFDTLLDDLSQKVPLPFGVRTVTTPRGTHTIKQLEQLQDGGCYLCSDRRQTKPINMELASKRPNIWYYHGRRPQRPETSSITPPGHFLYRQRRILLVKNSEPGMRRSVVLSRRSTRSLRAFLDEVSEVMQFHVRKLYTAEGRRIDSVQSLMTCPGVLVCVGREAFSPLLVNYIRKSSEEKLPGLGSRSPGLGPRTPGNGARSPATQGARSPPHGAQSRASEYSEGHESKKNVNFGLETKKSIIHPRSDSSNRSTRFSLSSEKSYGNGVSAYSQARPAIMNDDIEKRVLVNKDGSLSVEMRVRFRLHNDESLQWSTQIKKSPSLNNESCPLSQNEPHFLQHGQSESCSDPDSVSFGTERVDYPNQQPALEANHCPCCYHRQELQYDLWENPAPVPPPHPHAHTIMRHTHSSSSSSSCNSRRVVRCRAQLSRCKGVSGSEQSQLCMTEQVEHRVDVQEGGDACVEVCKVSRSCSHTEVVALEEERSVSAVSSSSHILQSLQEDQDDEDDELPPSASQCCHCSEPPPTPGSQTHLSDKPTSKVSASSKEFIQHKDRGTVTSSRSKSSRHSYKSSKVPKSEEEEEAADGQDEEVKRVFSGLSQKSGTSSVCRVCGGCKRSVSESRASHQGSLNPANQENGKNGSEGDGSDDSTQSNKTNLTNCEGLRNGLEEEERSVCRVTAETEEERSPSATSAKSNCSGTAAYVRKKEDAEGGNTAERAGSSLSAKSDVSAKSNKSHSSQYQRSSKAASPTDDTVKEDDNKRPPSQAKSDVSASSGKAERPVSAVSAKSNLTAKSGTSHQSIHQSTIKEPGHDEGDEVEQRTTSAMSAKSNVSVNSNKSHKSARTSERPVTPRSDALEDGEERAASQKSIRSLKSSATTRSLKLAEETDEKENHMADVETEQTKSEKEERAASAGTNYNGNKETESETGDNMGDNEQVKEVTLCDRSSSAMSSKSHASAKSFRFQESNHAGTFGDPNDTDVPAAEANNENQKRVASSMSVKSKSSMKSNTSHKSNSTKTQKSVSPCCNVVTIKTPEGFDEDRNETVERAQSAASALSQNSNCSGTAADMNVVKNDFKDSQMLSPRRTRSPRTHSPKVQSPVLPGGETRGLSALSVHSTTSTKSGRTKCRCGATSAKEDEKLEDKEENEDLKGEQAESSSSKRQRRKSGGTEELLSRNSSGSVSLGLPEEQEAAESDSGKSHVSFQAPNKGSSVIKDVEATEITSSHDLPVVEIPTIETPGEGADETEEKQKPERTASANSARSSRSSCKCSIKAAELKTGSVKSASTTKQSRSSCVKSSGAPRSSKESANYATGNQATSRPASGAQRKEDITGDKSFCCLRPESAASAHLKQSKEDSSGKSDSGSVKTSDSQKKETPTKSSSSLHRPCSKVETLSESTLSQSLSAADLLKETMVAQRPHSCRSKASRTSDKPRSEKSVRCQRNKKQKDQEEELTPACLPNASPSEVVSDWLRSIPANGSMLTLDDELNELQQEAEEKPDEEVAKEEISEDEKLDKEKSEAEEEQANEEEAKSDAAEVVKGSDPALDAVGTSSCPNTLSLTGESLSKNWHSSAAVMKVLLSSSLGRCQSMPEVSPVYGRRLSTSARGLLDCLAQLQLIEPAVSIGRHQQKDQHYEDIMAILQSLWLTEPRGTGAKDGGIDQVTPPRSSSGVDMSSGSGGSGKENQNHGEDEMPPKEPGSLNEDEGAGKAVEEEEEQSAEAGDKTGPEETSPEQAILEEPIQDEATVAHFQDSPKVTEKPSSSDKSSPNDSSKSPTDNEQETLEDSGSGTPPTVLRAPLTKRFSQDPDPAWVLHLLKKLEKQFMNHYIDAMAEFKVRWDLDDSLILNKMIMELKDEVSLRIQSSVEREMKKIQSRAGKGGRSPRPPHGANLSRESTMTEKRRRMLKVMKNQSVKTADSFSDEDMMGDFSDQRSVDDYCPCDACVRRKMATRPHKTNPMAAEAPVIMEFDLLKILQLKKSPSPATALQPADVEGEEEERNLEVVQEEEEEDETKEDIKADVDLEETIPETGKEGEEEELGGEEAGEQEEDETKEDIKADVDLEETIPETAEEGEEELGGEEAGEQEEEEDETKEDNKADVDLEETIPETGEEGEEELGGEEAGEQEEEEDETKQEEGEKEELGGEEAGEQEEDEEEEEECQCHAARNDNEGEEAEEGDEEGEDNEETHNNTGEDEGRAEDAEDNVEEESDKETVKKAGDEEISENEEIDEETTGRESGEEAAPGETEDNNATEELTPLEESAAGNISASAEEQEEPHEDEKREETGEQEEAEDVSATQDHSAVCVTEGEEAEAEDSDADCKRPFGAETTGDEEQEAEGHGDDEVVDAVDENEEEASGSNREDGALLHQFTRTSVESQPGSLEDIDTDSNRNSEVAKMAAGVSTGGDTEQGRSRSSERIKRRKPKQVG